MSLEVFCRESKIGDPKSKMAGAFGIRFRAHGGRGCGSRAAAEEDAADRIFIDAGARARLRPFRGNSAGSARTWLYRRKEHHHRIPICGWEVRTVFGACGRAGATKG